MSTIRRVLPLAALILACADARAASGPVLNCNITVQVTGPTTTQVDTYTKDFALQQGAAFADDFSSPTRVRTFDAVMAREGSNWVVSINYFNDIGVFDSVGFSTRLTANSGTTTTSGTTDFATSLPSARRYVAAYTLTCRKA